MDKRVLFNKIKNFGDAAITFNDRRSIVVTIDFRNDYIKTKRKIKNNGKGIYAFSWTDDSFVNINASKVISVIPLSKILGNK